MARARSRERIRVCVRAAADVLQRQVTAATPGWPGAAGDPIDPRVTAIVLGVPDLWTDGGAAARRATQTIRSVLRTPSNGGDAGVRAESAAALLRLDGTDVDGQIARVHLLQVADA